MYGVWTSLLSQVGAFSSIVIGTVGIFAIQRFNDTVGVHTSSPLVNIIRFTETVSGTISPKRLYNVTRSTGTGCGTTSPKSINNVIRSTGTGRGTTGPKLNLNAVIGSGRGPTGPKRIYNSRIFTQDSCQGRDVKDKHKVNNKRVYDRYFVSVQRYRISVVKISPSVISYRPTALFLVGRLALYRARSEQHTGYLEHSELYKLLCSLTTRHQVFLSSYKAHALK